MAEKQIHKVDFSFPVSNSFCSPISMHESSSSLPSTIKKTCHSTAPMFQVEKYSHGLSCMFWTLAMALRVAFGWNCVKAKDFQFSSLKWYIEFVFGYTVFRI